MLALGHVFYQQLPRHLATLDEVLVHAEHVATPLWLVGAEATGGMQNAGRNKPAGARLETVGAAKVEDAVVSLVPILEALAHLLLGRAGLEAHEGVREIVADVVVLRRKIITLRLAFLPDQLRLLGVLVHVVRDGPHVVEEF